MHEFLNYSQKTDEELAKLTLRNQSVFLHIMKRYEQKLMRYILRITSVPLEEAEDILQEVFIKVYTNLNDFNAKLKFSSWIYRITHNEVINNFRKKQARPQSVNWELNEEMLNNIASAFDIKKEIEIQFLRKNIALVLNSMDEKYSEVLVLYFLEEKDYKEISDILKKPMGTVETLLSRAKKQFKQEMEKQNIPMSSAGN